jgi:hypothetical protein
VQPLGCTCTYWAIPFLSPHNFTLNDTWIWRDYTLLWSVSTYCHCADVNKVKLNPSWIRSVLFLSREYAQISYSCFWQIIGKIERKFDSLFFIANSVMHFTILGFFFCKATYCSNFMKFYVTEVNIHYISTLYSVGCLMGGINRRLVGSCLSVNGFYNPWVMPCKPEPKMLMLACISWVYLNYELQWIELENFSWVILT